jgi:hypothetical protein
MAIRNGPVANCNHKFFSDEIVDYDLITLCLISVRDSRAIAWPRMKLNAIVPTNCKLLSYSNRVCGNTGSLEYKPSDTVIALSPISRSDSAGTTATSVPQPPLQYSTNPNESGTQTQASRK